MDESVASKLSRLADLHDSGVLSDKEFETLKAQLFGASRRYFMRQGGALAGMVLVIVAVILLLVGSTRPSSSSPKVAFSTVALTESQVQVAINYAMTQVGQSKYDGLCLQLVHDAYEQAGVNIGTAYDPVDYWANNPEGYTEHAAPDGPYGTPPAGAILFWGTTQWSSDGHAAISLGNGTVVSSAAYPYADGPTEGQVFALSKRSPSTYHYLGYVIPGDLVTSSTPAPVASAPVTTAPAPAAPTSSSGGSHPAGSSPVQPAAGAGAVQSAAGSGTVQPAAGGGAVQGSGSSSAPSTSSSTSTSAPPASVPPTTPGPTTTQATTAGTVPPPTQSTPSPSPVTYSETTGGVSHTWTNYSNAGGTQGPSIASNQTVQITCKVTGFAVADGNTWWYQIAVSPWNNAYYVSADAFYNDGAISGNLIGTPFVDPAVPNC